MSAVSFRCQFEGEEHMVLMHSDEGWKVSHRFGLLRLAFIAALALVIALPAWAAPPPNFKGADVGEVGAAGSVDVGADGVWTVKGAGELPNTGPADGFYFVYQEIEGDGVIVARLVSQNTSEGTPKTGI